MQYHHLGIPTTEPRPGEVYLEALGLHCTDHEDNPFGIQWMRYDADCPLPELVTAPNQTTLAPGELILGYTVSPPPEPEGQVFLKVGRRHEVAVSRLNLAACLDRAMSDPRVVLGSCFPSPRRLADVEELIKSGEPGPALWRAAGEKAAGHFTDVCGWRSSATYKVPAITRVTARALSLAWAGLEERS